MLSVNPPEAAELGVPRRSVSAILRRQPVSELVAAERGLDPHEAQAAVIRALDWWALVAADVPADRHDAGQWAYQHVVDTGGSSRVGAILALVGRLDPGEEAELAAALEAGRAAPRIDPATPRGAVRVDDAWA